MDPAAARPGREAASVAEPQPPPVPPSRPPGLRRIDGGDHFGCRGRNDFGDLTRLAVQGDREAFVQALTTGILSGGCVMFEDGPPVFVSDTASFSGLVKVRPKGELAQYWTAYKALTKQ